MGAGGNHSIYDREPSAGTGTLLIAEESTLASRFQGGCDQPAQIAVYLEALIVRSRDLPFSEAIVRVSS